MKQKARIFILQAVLFTILYFTAVSTPASELDDYYFNPAGIVNNLDLVEWQINPMQLIMLGYTDRLNLLIEEVEKSLEINIRLTGNRLRDQKKLKELAEELYGTPSWGIKFYDLRKDTAEQVARVLDDEQLAEWNRLMDNKDGELYSIIKEEYRHIRMSLR